MSDFPMTAVRASSVGGIEPEPYFMSADGLSHRPSHTEAEELRGLLRSIAIQRAEYAPLSINMETIEHLNADSLSRLQFPRQKCLFCTNEVVISPYGEVLPCVYYNRYVMGNLSDKKLNEVWGNEAHRTFVGSQHSNRLPLCDHCSIKPVHRPLLSTLSNETRRLSERLQARWSGRRLG
jgi:radical SAM protein with 4Fe4S-binding SPASM domain